MKIQTALACAIMGTTCLAGTYALSAVPYKNNISPVNSTINKPSKNITTNILNGSKKINPSSITKVASLYSPMKEHKPYEGLVTKYAKEYNVPIKLANAIIHTESNYNPHAHGKAGEIGLMQLMPTTARGLGFKGPLSNLYNPDVNIHYGMSYLSKAVKLGKGDLCRTILKYNAGAGAKHMNPVSARYCTNVQNFLVSA